MMLSISPTLQSGLLTSSEILISKPLCCHFMYKTMVEKICLTSFYSHKSVKHTKDIVQHTDKRRKKEKRQNGHGWKASDHQSASSGFI